ncbi:MAG: SRPBCC family protein [Hyphomicrobiales bacterium]|nr:SRPBCC family protein [Hyphomicrobiales bacterium]
MSDFGELTARDSVRIERLLPGPIDRVWSYFLDPDKRRLWIGGGILEPFAGGRVDIAVQNARLSDEGDPPPPKYAGNGGEGRIAGRVIACEPPHLLAYRWHHSGAEASEVRIELAQHGERVRLTLTHERLPSRDGLLSVSAGWHTHLDILDALLSGQVPTSFWRTMTALEADYDRRIPPW